MQQPARAPDRDGERRELRRLRGVHATAQAAACRISCMLTLGTGVGGGVVVRRPALSRVDRARAHGDRRGRRAVPGRVLGPRARRGVLLGPARRTGSRGEVLGPGATAHDLVAANHPALGEIGHHLGVAIGSLVNIFGARARRDRRRVRRRGVRSAPARRAAGGARARRSAPAGAGARARARGARRRGRA